MENLVQLLHKQQALIKQGVSILVKHYESGTFSFVVQKHNGDATGWTKISPFMNKGCYTYEEALEAGFEWYEKHKLEEEKIGDKVKVATGSDFGSMVKVKL